MGRQMDEHEVDVVTLAILNFMENEVSPGEIVRLQGWRVVAKRVITALDAMRASKK